MLHCKFSGDYNSERIFKIDQHLTKLCVEHLGFTFLAHPVCPVNFGLVTARRRALNRPSWRLLVETATSTWHEREREREMTMTAAINPWPVAEDVYFVQCDVAMLWYAAVDARKMNKSCRYTGYPKNWPLQCFLIMTITARILRPFHSSIHYPQHWYTHVTLFFVHLCRFCSGFLSSAVLTNW